MKAEYVTEALEPATLAAYKSTLKHYELFCRKQGTPAWPAKIDIIEDCSTWLMYSGTPSIVANLWSAIKFEQTNRGHGTLIKSDVLKKLHVKALKLAADSARPLRDPIPVEAIVQFCNSGSEHDPLFVTKAAIVTVGCRALLRYNELANLKMKDILFVSGQLRLELGTRKNKLQRAAPIFIDRSLNDTHSCPVEWMERHIAMRKQQRAGPMDFVFPSKYGKILSYNVISEYLQEVARFADAEHLLISTHSMRITGAVMMMMAGFDNLKIQIMGDWKSQIFLRYLRTIGIAAEHATTRMGL